MEFRVGFFFIKSLFFNPAGRWDVVGYLNKATVIPNKYSMMLLPATVQALGVLRVSLDYTST